MGLKRTKRSGIPTFWRAYFLTFFYFANILGEIQELRYAKWDLYKWSTFQKVKNKQVAPPIVVYWVKIDQKLYITYGLSPKENPEPFKKTKWSKSASGNSTILATMIVVGLR